MTQSETAPLQTSEACSADFAGIDTWIFDLDNTLYPRRTDLFSQIDARMTRFVAEFLKLPADEARALQKGFYREHGTTLRGLMNLHDVDPDVFLRFVHDIDYSGIAPDPALGEEIKALPGRRFIFTNGDRGHAERTARALGILDHFEDIFDIVAAGLNPKPAPATYRNFVALFGLDAQRSAMFEDLARNLEAPKHLGMKTILIVPPALEDEIVEAFAESWEFEGRGGAHIDFVTDDLAAFLRRVRTSA